MSEGKEGEESPQAGSSDKVESRGGVVDCRVESLGGSVLRSDCISVMDEPGEAWGPMIGMDLVAPGDSVARTALGCGFVCVPSPDGLG